ncbi:MAG: TetR/AcrR family transcriptional regulator [Deltaproteobacteria bacterium]|nr:TetR/AcrR family transcriptional regulator [Deltaproteobacteria bacterium]
MAEANSNKEILAERAMELFAERGFAGTSIRDIANSTGLSISNIYHHFGNKEGLLLSILEEASRMLLTRLREPAQTDADPLERFKALIRIQLELSSLMKKEAKIFFLDEEHLSPEGREKNRTYQEEILEIYRQCLQDLQEAGLANIKSATIAAFNVLGVLNWHLRWYRPQGRLSREEVCQEVTSFILHGIAGCPEAGGVPPGRGGPGARVSQEGGVK